ncbi:hypothetical protein [Acidocella sp.]|uniref:hypothetical protein n=1 Tax=Acidocella sp. TaxID=50710 RepID=UPI002F40D6CA
MNYMNTDLPANLPQEPDIFIRSADAAAAAPVAKDLFQALAVPPAPTLDEAALHRTNLLMAQLFVTALGIDQEVRLSGLPAWTSLCRTTSFGMALDLLELCNLRELGLHGDRNDPHFDADKVAALIGQINEISKYSSRTAPVVGWPLEDLAYALADLLGPAETRIEVQVSVDHIRMPPVQAHVVSVTALRLFLAILRRRHETRGAGPVGLSVTKVADEVTLIVTDHACRGGHEDGGLRKQLMRFGGSIDASFLWQTPDEHAESVTMRFTLPR